jgi:ABC-2 type transport system ATP-binding protein
MIQTENLTKYYGLIKAIENVSFTINKGEVVGFLGPNAAGKTTTLRIITGYFPPTSGKVKINGYDIIDKPMEAKAMIGYMPENPPLYTDMTVKSFLNFVSKIRAIPKNKRKEAFDKAVELSGLKNHLKSIIGHLSKGYKQRVSLAQALLHDPEILILDEPTAGLDAKERLDLLNMIREFIGKKTVILSTHILADVEKVCNRVIIIHKGNIVAEGSQEMLSSHLSENERFVITIQRNENQLESELRTINGIINITKFIDNPKRFIIESKPDPNIKENITKLCVEKNFGLIELSPSKLPLEEIFLKLTKE